MSTSAFPLLIGVLIYTVFTGCVHCQRLKLEPNLRTLWISNGDNATILCNAAEFGPLRANQVSWSGPGGDQISNLGTRIFASSYNRWRYVRLVITRANVTDSGSYTCSGVIQGDEVAKRINIIVRARQIVLPQGTHEGPRRGDVRVIQPQISEVRPVRDLSGIIKRHRRGLAPMNTFTPPSTYKDFEGTDAMFTTTPMEEVQTSETSTENMYGFTSDVTKAATPEPDLSTVIPDMESSSFSKFFQPDTTSSPKFSLISGETNEGSGEMTSMMSDISFDTSSVSALVQTTTAERTPAETTGAETTPAKTTPAMTTRAKSTTMTKTSAVVTFPPAPVPRETSRSVIISTRSTTLSSSSTTMSRDSVAAGAAATSSSVKKNGEQATTAFGKYGLIAFALALSAAILLLYTLILINVIIPRCCKKKQSVNFKTEKTTVKDSGPTSVDVVAMKPLLESRPNSPEVFTTVDLDDKPSPLITRPPETEKPNGAPASPSVPQSPSKYVTTFTIGRKPSDVDPDGVYIHEGKPGEVIQPLPEMEAATDAEAASKEQSGDTSKDSSSSKSSSRKSSNSEENTSNISS